MHRLARGLAALFAIALFVGLVGCGTNLPEILYQTGAATGRSFFDMFLTDMANAVADACDANGTADEGEDGDDGDNGEDGNGDDVDDGGDGNGGALDGSDLYANNCAACHGADGASGFAPAVTGMTADELSAGLESATHGSISLTDEEIAAIAEFLAG